MTVGGWITMVLSVGFVVGLFTWCIFKVLTTPSSEKRLHSLDEIDTRDQE